MLDMRVKQPNSHHCFICGLKSPVGLKMAFYNSGPDEVTTELTVPAYYQGYPGVVHGGITAAVLDETGGRSIWATGERRFYVTMTMEVKYRHPVPVETPLTVVGQVKHLRGRRAHTRAEIRTLDGKVLAEAMVVLIMIPEERTAFVDLDAMGWRVYE